MSKSTSTKIEPTEPWPAPPGETLAPGDFMFGANPAERQFLQQISILPRVTVFIARKINLGNFENVDFSFTAQVPLGLEEEQLEKFNVLSSRAIEQGLGIVVPEVNAQTEKIKAQRRATEVK
jgi:hypothetical protein